MQGIEECAPGFEAVDGAGAVEIAGELELGFEDFALGGVGIFDPTVEAAFSDGGIWETGEVVAKGGEPVRGVGADLPGVKSEGGDDEAGVVFGELGDRRPVVLAGSIDNAGGDARGFHFFDQGFLLSCEPWVLKMIVSINQHGVGRARRLAKWPLLQRRWR